MKEKYVVYGMGVTGLAVCEYFIKHQIDFNLLILDKQKNDSKIKPYESKIILVSEFDQLLNENFVLVRSPGIPHYDEIIKKCYKVNIPVISEIELAYHFNQKGKYLLVSGSNGKTTLVNLLAVGLKACNKKVILAGNIGEPLISLIDTIDDDTYVALELSSFQLENTYSLQGEVAVLTNLTPNHLNHVVSLEYYYQSKLKIASLLKSHGVFVVNADDKVITTNLNTLFKQVFVSLVNSNCDYYYSGNKIKVENKEWIVNHPYLIGDHNKLNILMAFAILRQLQLDENKIISALIEFKGVEYRLQYLGKHSGIRIYNDAKSTTPTSTLAAIKALKPAKIHLLLGGESKNLDFDELKMENIFYYAYGQAKDEIKKVILDAFIFKDIKEAYSEALSRAKSDEVILLSPSCASFDQFKDYIERGKYFSLLVKEKGLDYE